MNGLTNVLELHFTVCNAGILRVNFKAFDDLMTDQVLGVQVKGWKFDLLIKDLVLDRLVFLGFVFYCSVFPFSFVAFVGRRRLIRQFAQVPRQ